ncbi:MAG: LpqN/LpqT family lipoprotein [Mycolicibacterium sp.]|uniref:LpqN/LpqT family lipoprotein n=1 Tax=Mycolicibacterium sp. TaxID=2320850 RepID=UPI003D14FDBB
MTEIARHWRTLAGGTAVGVAGVLGLAGGTATAQPAPPQQPVPAPVTVTQTVTVAPNAAPLTQNAATQQGVGVPVTAATDPGAVPAGVAAAASPAVPAGVATAAPPAVPAPQPVTIAPATSGTLHEYFAAAGVALEPQSSQGFRALKIVLPMPSGWEHVPDPNVPDAFAVIADRVGGNGLYSSNAQLVVYKLVGQFDPKEAISHGFVDSQQLPAWRSTDASLADFGGMPSALIEGTYREGSMTLNTSRRHVIATSGPENYLVSLSVTTSVDQVVPAASATDAIVNGFTVSVPAPAPAAPAATPPAAAAGLPPAPAATATAPAATAPAATAPAATAPAASAPAQAVGLQG